MNMFEKYIFTSRFVAEDIAQTKNKRQLYNPCFLHMYIALSYFGQ